MAQAVRIGLHGMRHNVAGPFSCIIVKGGEIAGSGSNRVLAYNGPAAHAETVAIRDACANLGSFKLGGFKLCTTCGPCPMCMGAIYRARPAKVYFANTRHNASGVGLDDLFIYTTS